MENLSGKISESHTQKESKDTKLETLYINTACNVSINTCFPLWVSRLVFSSHFYLCSPISQIFLKGFYSLCSVPPPSILRPFILMVCCILSLSRLICVCACLFAEDVKRLNEKLAETSKVKMELQLKLDDIQSSEASVQVRSRFHGNHRSSMPQRMWRCIKLQFVQ